MMKRTKQKMHWLICGYIVAFPEDSTLHEIGFAVAGSSKASVFHTLHFDSTK
jgi:hypothetical protein